MSFYVQLNPGQGQEVGVVWSVELKSDVKQDLDLFYFEYYNFGNYHI